MGISERKGREKMEMKALILSAATKMFLEDGYAKTSIRNIADAIEYSPGTIYLYFKDKDELLYEVQRDAFLKLLAYFNAKVRSKTAVKKLRQLCLAYVEFGLANPELYDLMFIIRAPTQVDCEVHKDNGIYAYGFLKDILKECIDQKAIRMTDLEQATLQVWSMGHGLISLNLRNRLKEVGTPGDLPMALISATDNFIDLIVT